jgi:formylglycine-generating enzyme required for sulfatase activity
MLRIGLTLGSILYALSLGLAPGSALAQSARAPGTVFKDCADCPEMVVIPAGSFDMGSPDGEAGRLDWEGPVHRVNVRAFALGRTHITRGQFAAFVRATGYDADDRCGRPVVRSGVNWRNPGFPQEDTHPVVCVSLKDARAYAQWLSRRTGNKYRLPSEAEWEYAARAGTTTARFWGESPDQACGYANVMDTTGKSQVADVIGDIHNCSDGYAYTAPAGTYKPNAFGLYDMIGNAWQWTEDCWREGYAGVSTDGSAWRRGNCGRRVLRGASWYDGPPKARSAKQAKNDPAIRYENHGFRLVRALF